MNKLVYLQSIVFMQLTRYKYNYLKYNKNIFQTRFVLFSLYSKILLFTMKKTAFIATDKQLITRFMALNVRNYNAPLVVNYIGLKLSQFFFLSSITKPIIRRYLRDRSIEGLN